MQGAWLALGFLACAGPGPERSRASEAHELHDTPQAGAARVARAEPDDRASDASCDLVRRVEAAIRADDPWIRRSAVYLLGRRGPTASIDAVGAAIHDPDARVRQAAIAALGSLGMRGEEGAAPAARYLFQAVESEAWFDRKQALGMLSHLDHPLSAEQERVVRRHLDDEAADVQIAAGLALQRAGLGRGLEPRVVQWIRQYSGGVLDWALASLLDSVQDPAHARVVEILFRSTRADVRHLAHVAFSRLEGAPERWREAEEIEREFSALTRSTSRALLRANWAAVERAVVLREAHDARLVLFGELHHDVGPTRDAQMQVLRAFVRDPAKDALGYEPSAQGAQQSVIDLAHALGLRVIPLETNWDNLGAAARWGARDLEARAAIEAFLDEDPAHRMFVIRGESHVQPGGYLVRLLREEPLILLSVVPIPLCLTGLFAEGTTFQSREHRRTYWLGCEDEGPTVFPALIAWLAAH